MTAQHASPLPTDYDARKAIPLASVVDYFPDAIVAIALVIGAGQKQHGTTGWDRAKSTDEENTLLRHFLERGTIDTDGVRHSAKVAWRALALLQKEIEAARGDGVISRGSYDSSKGETGPVKRDTVRDMPAVSVEDDWHDDHKCAPWCPYPEKCTPEAKRAYRMGRHEGDK